MNLLSERWLPVVRLDGLRERIAICGLLGDYGVNPVVDFESPRPDFYNAIYQLLIGIVQVAAAPDGERQWKRLWHKPYSAEEFHQRVVQYEDCFEIDSEGPAFMQDLDLKVEEAKEEGLTNLYINLPANDHFSVATPERIDGYWAAIALYTLQTFAPSGGRGHRVGLRGGGPLTSILLPTANREGRSPTLWEKIWLNILSGQYLPTLSGNLDLTDKTDIFPWMKPTKVSEETGTELYPAECHPYHMYFGMPRRIRLIVESNPGRCDLTSEQSEKMVTGYYTRHSGNNYRGAWVHPLNAYAKAKKPDGPPLSIKPQPGGVTYRHWLGLAFPKETHILPRLVDIAANSEYRKELLREAPRRLWAAGFDMDNMKSRCWYEITMPVYPLAAEASEKVGGFIELFVDGATELARAVQSTVKEAWFSSPKDAKGNLSFLGTCFWQNTEPLFYELVDRMVEGLDDRKVWSDCAAEWRDGIIHQAYALFDHWALAQQEEGLNMKRIVQARKHLSIAIGKVRKNFTNAIEAA